MATAMDGWSTGSVPIVKPKPTVDWMTGNVTGAPAAPIDYSGMTAAASAAGNAAATNNNPALNPNAAQLPTPPLKKQPIANVGVNQQAVNSFSPQAAPTAASGGLLSTPGAYENWIKQNAGAFSAPTATENLYGSGATSILSNSPLNTQTSQDNSSAYSSWLAGQGGSPTANSSAGVLAGAGTGPGNAQALYNTGGPSAGSSAGVLAGAGLGPQNSQSLFNSGGPNVGATAGVLAGGLTANNSSHLLAGGLDPQASSGVLGSLPTGVSNSTHVYDTAYNNLDAEGDMEAYYRNNANAFTGPGAYETAYNQNGDAFNDPGIGEKFYNQYGTDPMQLSDTEKLYNSGLGQLDPYYDYAEKRALQAAQTASSARGGFNSGLAAQQESDITGNLRGQQAKEWVDLAPQADNQRLARYGQGEKFAQDANANYNDRIKNLFGVAAGEDTAYSNRINNGANLANLSQNAEQSRFDTLSGIASRGDAADLGRNALRVTSANNVDQNAIGAFSAKGNVAGNADNANIGVFNAKANAANNIDQNSIGAFSALSTAGANADTAANNNLATRGNIASNADQASINAFSALGNVGQAADTAYNNNLSTRGNIASNADQAAINSFTAGSTANYNAGQLGISQQTANTSLAAQKDAANRANLTSQFQLAGESDAAYQNRMGIQAGLQKDLQSTGQNRILGGLNATTGLATTDAQLTQQVLSDVSSIDQMDATQLQALAEKYGVSIDKINAYMGDATALTKLLTEGGKALAMA